MISVNQKFIDSCNSDYVLSQLKIRVSTNKVGTVLCTLNDDEFNISSNSVEKQASSGAVCNIGGVCSNRIKIIINQKGIEKLDAVNGFKKNNVLHLIQWNRVDDANQNPVDYSLNLDDSENETGKCDLGFYYISEIKNNYYDCEITAYDGMLAFEKNLTIAQLKYMMTNSKTVDQWLAYFCTLVNDSNFNISYTDNADVTCNDGISFKLSDDSSFDKIREAISQLAQLKMAYATIDTQGNLTLKQAIKTDTSTYDDSVDNEYMFTCDNEVKESVVKLFYTSVAGFEYENTYQDEQGRNEINLYLEENKFLRGFEPYNGTALTSNTLTCLRNMSLEVMGYSFYSCECDINNRPYIELGDNVEVQRKLVDQQGTTTLMSIPCVVDSVSHEIGASTHLTSNSTVGTNEGSNTKTRINSQPKDPSTSSILNMFKSPVTKYTDETATVRIRLDDENEETFDDTEYKDNYTDGDTSYTLSNDTYMLTNINSYLEGLIYSHKVQEAEDGTYIYKSGLYDSDYKQLKGEYKVDVEIKALNSLINKQVLFSAGDKDNDLVTGTITGVSFYRGDNVGATGITPLSNIISRRIGSVIRQYTNYDFTTIINNIIKQKMFTGVGTHHDLSDGIKYSANYTVNLKSEIGSSIRTRLMNYDGFLLESDTVSDGYNVGKCVNPYINNYADIVKAWIFLYNIALYSSYTTISGHGDSFIEFTVEYEYNGQTYSKNMSLKTLMSYAGFGQGITQYYTPTLQPYSIDASYQLVANYINNNNLADNYLDILNTLYDSIKINVYDYFIESNYITTRAPLTTADKNKVDLGIVTQDDLEGLRAQVQQNTENIERLGNYINEVNNDLQDAKGDITQNTQNIASLDTRVTALEQGGGGGQGTFVVANPAGQATSDLTKLQVGSDIYAIHSGEGAELLLTRTTTKQITTTHEKFVFDAKVFENGSNFITYNTTTGDFEVATDCFVEINIWLNPNNTGGGWIYAGIAESDTSPTDADYFIARVASSLYSAEPFTLPLVRLRAGKKYSIFAYVYNSNTMTSTATFIRQQTGEYYLNNFVDFKKKSGTYYIPS